MHTPTQTDRQTDGQTDKAGRHHAAPLRWCCRRRRVQRTARGGCATEAMAHSQPPGVGCSTQRSRWPVLGGRSAPRQRPSHSTRSHTHTTGSDARVGLVAGAKMHACTDACVVSVVCTLPSQPRPCTGTVHHARAACVRVLGMRAAHSTARQRSRGPPCSAPARRCDARAPHRAVMNATRPHTQPAPCRGLLLANKTRRDALHSVRVHGGAGCRQRRGTPAAFAAVEEPHAAAHAPPLPLGARAHTPTRTPTCAPRATRHACGARCLVDVHARMDDVRARRRWGRSRPWARAWCCCRPASWWRGSWR
jgi:hypothetical protein